MPKSFDYSPASCGTFFIISQEFIFWDIYLKDFALICKIRGARGHARSAGNRTAERASVSGNAAF